MTPTNPEETTITDETLASLVHGTVAAFSGAR